VGCLYLDETFLALPMRSQLPRGLEVCYSPDAFVKRPW